MSYELRNLFSANLNNKISIDLHKLDNRMSKGEDRKGIIIDMTSEEEFNKWYDDIILEINKLIN